MRMTLRRSCATCAKAKHSCDLRTPKCSRCVKRNASCVYANEPLTASVVQGSNNGALTTLSRNDPKPTHVPLVSMSRSPLQSSDGANTLLSSSDASALSTPIGAPLDPFDSLPTTCVPRLRVQNLIYLFLSKISFQYYPLDLDPCSNPFLVSWWPLALQDPVLFNVSLQTASWDNEFHAKKGFLQSAALMKDCVSLLRQKIAVPTLAFQDATMNAVITLAAIEFGQGNMHVAEMHIEGVKRMVKVRGGISEIKKNSPLTARMVPWVAMLVKGSPQFETQDDFGRGDGISSISQWHYSSNEFQQRPGLLNLDGFDLDPELQNILNRLRDISCPGSTTDSSNIPTILSPSDLHDLTCFVLHKLLQSPPMITTDSQQAILSECLRYAASIYMFIIHGPTYFPHTVILQSLVQQLKYYLSLTLSSGLHDQLSVWLINAGMVGSLATSESKWFLEQASNLRAALNFQSWEEIKLCLESVLWLETGTGTLFRQAWEGIFASDTNTSPFKLALLPEG